MIEHPRWNPDTLPAPSGYAHALRAGGVHYLSGQVALDKDRNLIGPGDMSAQAEQTFSNLTRLLDAVGLEWGDVAKLNIYLTDISSIAAVRDVRDRVYRTAGTTAPATTTVEVRGLAVPGALIEVEAIAVRRGLGRDPE
jgi:enamine deaminase RidA (YjgF/YER057c/UK114 family)